MRNKKVILEDKASFFGELEPDYQVFLNMKPTQR